MQARSREFMRKLLLAFMILSSAASAGDEPRQEPDFQGEIIIGATFPLTGHLDTYGHSAYYGANTCVKTINAAGGVNGKKLVLEWRDNESNPVKAIKDIEDLRNNHGVPAILGPLLSNAAMAVRPAANKLGVVVMTPMTTTDAVTKGNPWMFRACFTNTAQADSLVKFQMRGYGAKTGAILYDSRYSFSIELATIFEQLFTDQGGKIVGSFSFVTDDGKVDYKTPLIRLAALQPDFIFAPTHALEATEIMYAARETGIPTRFCGSHTWDVELVFDASGTRLIGSSFPSALFEQAFSYQPFQTFFNAMEQAGMDNPDAQAACAWDAVMLLAEGLKAGETPEAIRDGLLGVKLLPLATGRTTMSPEGDPIKPVLIRVVERKDGHLRPVYAERFDP